MLPKLCEHIHLVHAQCLIFPTPKKPFDEHPWVQPDLPSLLMWSACGNFSTNGLQCVWQSASMLRM